MAFFDCHFFSDALGLTVSAYVILPQQTARQIGMGGAATKASKGFPTLYLLHGLSDDHTIWLRRTSIERYAATKNVAIVMPAVARSFYQDMADGPRYWTYVSEELPSIMRGFFPLSAEREDNFAAGLSMGGYGALRMALGRPDKFAAGASLSGALDMGRRVREAGRNGSLMSKAELMGIFGQDLKCEGTETDLFYLAQKAAVATPPQPKLYISCGTEDGLLGESRLFKKHLESLHLEAQYEEALGTHEWGFWDAQIQKVLAWLPLKG
jgi:S-formylglutathione hydrolase FrmB